ncbi:MAG: hypothetical protein L3J51_06310 [Cocleimonas sp.]|nr:hypothetical protein [Cocleimonas sp.]
MTEKDPFYMNEHEQPQQNKETGVPPAADNNVQSITKDVVLVRTAKGSHYGGGGGVAWWAIGLITIMVLVFSYWGYIDYLEDKAQNRIEASYYYWGLPLFLSILFPIISLWVWIPWRTHLPIVFNRSTQKISFWYENELWQGDWKKAEAHTHTVTSAGYATGVGTDPILSLNVIRDPGDYPEDKGNLYLRIYGTQQDRDFCAGKPLSVQAQQIWEYIRLYMNEGMEAVPPPIHDQVIWEHKSFKALLKHNYLATTEPETMIGFIALFPISVINFFNDLCYYLPNRWLPRKAIPPELQAAIDARGITHDK